MIKSDILRDELKFLYGAITDLESHIVTLKRRINSIRKQLQEEEKVGL